MKNKNTPLRLAVLALVAILPVTPAIAQQEGGYFYGGVGAGVSRADFDQAGIDGSLVSSGGLPNSGLTFDGFSSDERSQAWRLFGGYQINRNVGVEFGYHDLGRFDFTANSTSGSTLSGRTRFKGVGLDLVLTLPLSERFSVLGRVGAHHTRADGSYSLRGAVTEFDSSPSRRSAGPKVGVGLQYAFSPGFLVRGEAERYRVDDSLDQRANVDVLSVSLVFPFGRAAAPVARTAAAPAYVAPAPAYVAPAPPPPPPPVVVQAPPPPPPPPPEPRRVSFSAESLFGFDQAALQPAGRAALDAFVRETAGTRYDEIAVEGHTDRLGSDAYNEALSLRRAEAVKAYLVASGGIEASRVRAVGMGETRPVTAAGQCKGERPSAALIACLQPDRRVDVEVTGTR